MDSLILELVTKLFQIDLRFVWMKGEGMVKIVERKVRS